MTVMDRFLQKVVVSPSNFYNNSPCWEWLGGKVTDGYGTFWNDKAVYSHRFIYEYFNGQIEPELVVHHLCYNRQCCNVSHLDVRTNRDNSLDKDSVGIAAKNAKKTHCLRGHEFTPNNTNIKSNGSRECKACWNVRNKSKGEKE